MRFTIAWRLGLVLVMVGGPLLVMIAGMIISWRFHLNARTHEVLVHEV